MNIYSLTDIGSRFENQDHYWVTKFRDSDTDSEIVVGVLCDGVGGLEQGGVTSRELVKQVRASVSRGVLDLDSIENLVLKYNDIIVNSHINSGSTIDYFVISDNTLQVLHAGDSRVYALPNVGNCVGSPLTSDDSALNHLRSQGVEMTPEVVSKNLNKLTNAIGMPKLTLHRFSVGLSDTSGVLVASDGFWHIFDMQSWELVSLDTTFLSLALDKGRFLGETDNATAILVTI